MLRRQAILFASLALLVAVVVVYATRASETEGPGQDRSDLAAPGDRAVPPFSASVEILDPDQGAGRIEWHVGPSLLPTPASTIVGYEIEVVVDGRSLTPAPVPVADPFVEADLWAGFGRWDADVPFLLHVRAHFDDGTSSARLSQDLVLPAIVERADDWITGTPETMVSYPGSAHGLPMWVDGSIGFAALGSGVRGFGANGPSIASWEVGTDAFVSRVNHTDLAIVGQEDAYAAGGPVYVHAGDLDDPDDDRLIMIYHGEDHRQAGADPTRWWGYLGLAISDDEGETFVDAGKIVVPHIPVTEPLPWGIEVGGGSYAIVEDDGVPYFYVYFRDTLAEGANVKLAVARASVASVVAAAEACVPSSPPTCVAPPFDKFDGSSWGERGVTEDGTSGGSPADLFGSSPYVPGPIWFDVVELSSRGLYVLLFSWQVPSDVPAGPANRGWSYAVSLSTDGLDWSRPVRIIDTDATQELIYLTLAARDVRSARVAATDELAIYRTRTEFSEPGPPSRWAGDVFLDRLALTYRP